MASSSERTAPPTVGRGRRFVASFLAAVFFYSNVVAAHAAEANFWSERRSAARRAKDGPSPAGFSAGGPLSSEQYQALAQLPKAGQVSLGVSQSVSVGSGLIPSGASDPA